MINKKIYLIVGIIALAILIYTFIGDSDHIKMFGKEMSILIYRGFWGILTIGFLYAYFKSNKK